MYIITDSLAVDLLCPLRFDSLLLPAGCSILSLPHLGRALLRRSKFVWDTL